MAGKKVYNRPEMKLEYFQSEEMGATVRANKYYGPRISGAFQAKIKGWQQDKREFLAKATAKAEKMLLEKQAKKYKIDTEKLLSMKSRTIDLMLVRLNEYVGIKDKNGNINKKDIDIKDLKEILKSVKIELNEPINISNNYNTNTIDKELDEDEQALIQTILDLEK